jgi:guanylate kinase
VVSSPSGAGKGSILGTVIAEDVRLAFSVSATTRPPRKREVDGEHYRFVDEDMFQRWVSEGRFIEWAEVHSHRYGTLKEDLERQVASGDDVILELDVQGMRQVKKWNEAIVSIFIMAQPMEELERRIRSRGTITEEDLQVRLATAEKEISVSGEYDHILVNDVLEEAIVEFQGIIRAVRSSVIL